MTKGKVTKKEVKTVAKPDKATRNAEKKTLRKQMKRMSK